MGQQRRFSVLGGGQREDGRGFERVSWIAEGGGSQGGSHVPPSVPHIPRQRLRTCLLHVFIRVFGDVSASGPCALPRRQKWRGDKRFSGDVACKHQSFG